MMITRKEYMDGQLTHATHREYYGQFVGPTIKRIVEISIGKTAILNSHDPYLNDIALRRWDSLKYSIITVVGDKLAEANGSNDVSLSDTVCVAKEAARQIQEEND